jgi:thioredoxin 1
MSELIKHISDASFDDDVLKSGTPVLVDYWAEWCGPCRAIAPALEELAAKYEGKVQIVKLNVDENGATASKYGIRGIPTLSIFKGGEVVQSLSGARPKSEMSAFIEAHI